MWQFYVVLLQLSLFNPTELDVAFQHLMSEQAMLRFLYDLNKKYDRAWEDLKVIGVANGSPQAVFTPKQFIDEFDPLGEANGGMHKSDPSEAEG